MYNLVIDRRNVLCYTHDDSRKYGVVKKRHFHTINSPVTGVIRTDTYKEV